MSTVWTPRLSYVLIESKLKVKSRSALKAEKQNPLLNRVSKIEGTDLCYLLAAKRIIYFRSILNVINMASGRLSDLLLPHPQKPSGIQLKLKYNNYAGLCSFQLQEKMETSTWSVKWEFKCEFLAFIWKRAIELKGLLHRVLNCRNRT